MASVELRLTRLEATLNRPDTPPGLIVMVGANGIARRPGGVEVDLATLTTVPGGPLSVVLRRGEPAPPRLVATDPPPPDPDR